MTMHDVNFVMLMFLAKGLLRANAVLIRAIGRRLPRNIDPVTGKDRMTGAKLAK
jgi:hypothetical protein